MLRTLLFLSIILSASAFAAPEDHIISVKERIRVSLWIEGIEADQPKVETKQVRLPEEIEIALKKL